MGPMADELPRFLRVARAVALVSTASACGGATSEAPVTVAPVEAKPVPSASASSSEDEKPTVVADDPTIGSGPCRCSWDTNTAAASRVCKKQEVAYTGGLCNPANRPKYPMGVGPLPPPDLAIS
jgi:hypothetical protein